MVLVYDNPELSTLLVLVLVLILNFFFINLVLAILHNETMIYSS